MEVARSPRMRPRFFRSTSFNPYKISALLLLTSCFVVIIFSQKMREIWNQKQWRKCYLCGFRNFAAQKINHNKENIVRNPWRSGGKEIHQGQLPGLTGRLLDLSIAKRVQLRWQRTSSCPCHSLFVDLSLVRPLWYLHSFSQINYNLMGESIKKLYNIIQLPRACVKSFSNILFWHHNLNPHNWSLRKLKHP